MAWLGPVVGVLAVAGIGFGAYSVFAPKRRPKSKSGKERKKDRMSQKRALELEAGKEAELEAPLQAPVQQAPAAAALRSATMPMMPVATAPAARGSVMVNQVPAGSVMQMAQP